MDSSRTVFAPALRAPKPLPATRLLNLGTAPLRRPVFLFFAFIYLYSFPYFDRLRSANEMPRILMTQEIVERGTCRIDARVSEMSSTFDTSRGVDGHLYSNKAPGPSFVAVPAYAVLKLVGQTSMKVSTWAFRVFAVTLPALLFLFFFYRLAGRFAMDESARCLALVAYALGSSAFPYSILFMSHQLASVCLGGGFVAAVTLARDNPRRPKLLALLVGGLCAAAVLMDYQTLFIAPLVGFYTLVRAKKRLRNLTLMVAGAIPFAVALGAYHTIYFGSPLTTPLTSSNETAVQSGFMGLIGPNWNALFVLLFDPSNGLFVLMPWVIFAILGFGAVMSGREGRRRAGAEAVLCLLVFVVYVVLLGSLVPNYARAGWAVGPRYLGAAFPFIGWLAAAGFGAAYRWFATRVLAQGLVIAAAVIYVAAVTTFPHWPDGLKSPLYELTFRLVYHGYSPYSLATALGLWGIWAQLPLYLVAFAFVAWLLQRGQKRGVLAFALACLVAAGVLASYRAFPLTGPYAQHAWGFVTGIWEPTNKW